MREVSVKTSKIRWAREQTKKTHYNIIENLLCRGVECEDDESAAIS